MRKIKIYLTLTIIALTFSLSVSAQGGNFEFSYQGFITDNATPANGNYDLDFRLLSAAVGGTIFDTDQHANVTVTKGVFNVVLNFTGIPIATLSELGGDGFYLEIAVRAAGGGTFTPLTPRSRILPVPLATLAAVAENANRVGGVTASQLVRNNDPRLSDARDPLPGNTGYVQNGTNTQPASNFNISGNGTAGTLTGGIVTAATQFNIGVSRVLASPGAFNFFAGNLAGNSNTTGTGNAFFGVNAGVFNSTGGSNTFVGFEAGRNNNVGANNSYFGKDAGRTGTTGNDNAFFGNDAGQSNTTGSSNSFFGKGAGADNTTAAGNSFFGALAGSSNTTGSNNAFYGFEAGSLNTEAFNNSFFGSNAGKLNIGDRNSFFGTRAGDSNTTGDDNSFFGTDAGGANSTAIGNSFFGARGGASNTTGSSNAFFGFEAGQINTEGSNNSYFGFGAGRGNTTAFNNSFFGAHTGEESTGFSNAFFGAFAGRDNTIGFGNTFLGNASGIDNTTGIENTLVGDLSNVAATGLTNATAVGSRAVVGQSNALVLGSVAGINNASTTINVGIGTTTPQNRLHVNGIIRVETLGSAGTTSLCRNASNQISTCSSSLRYKNSIEPYLDGFEIVNRLHPIAFIWKDGGMRDLGLGAEDVEKVEPLLVTYNEKGVAEGVKYDRIAVVLLNAIKEQQAQIERQEEKLGSLEARIEELERSAKQRVKKEK